MAAGQRGEALDGRTRNRLGVGDGALGLGQDWSRVPVARSTAAALGCALNQVLGLGKVGGFVVSQSSSARQPREVPSESSSAV